jgi:hypothetical protein
VQSAFWAVLLLVVLLFGGGIENARAAPQEALNKTVTIAWSSFTPADCANGSKNRVSRNVRQQIYISTQGRLFSKTAARAGNASKDWSVAPSGSGQFRFSGEKIIGTFPQASGAAQLTITFDPPYQNCTAEVIHGSEVGKVFVWTNLAGVKCTATGKSTVSDVSCSVRPGNAFAD